MLKHKLIIYFLAIFLKENKTTVTKTALATPQKLLIPKIQVSAYIESVGQDNKGRMDVPKDTNNVAWYNLGFKPGELGNAVIAGHLDDKLGKPSVFYDLADLQPGDEIFVIDENGKQFQFIVTKQVVYNDNQFPLNEIFATTGNPQLILITCFGFYDYLAKNYSQRIVVYSELQT